MICPEEYQEIKEKILTLASGNHIFGVPNDCIRAFFGDHSTGDWQEVARDMAIGGVLQRMRADGDGQIFYRLKEVKPMTETERKFGTDTPTLDDFCIVCGLRYGQHHGSICPEPDYDFATGKPTQTYYKVVERMPDGRLVSTVRQHTPEELEYKPGEIAYDHQGGSGIFVWEDYKAAVAHAEGFCTNGFVFECTPLGKAKSCYGQTTYPAILLGKKVWQQEPAEKPCPLPSNVMLNGIAVAHGMTRPNRFVVSPYWLRRAGFRGKIIVTKGQYNDEPAYEMEVGDDET